MPGGSLARMSAEPTRIASAPASSAAAPCAREAIAALGDDDPVARRLRDERQLGAPVDLEGREVAGVDPDRLRVEPNGPLQLLGVVSFHERVELELAGGAEELQHRRVVEIAEQEQHGVGTGLA